MNEEHLNYFVVSIVVEVGMVGIYQKTFCFCRYNGSERVVFSFEKLVHGQIITIVSTRNNTAFLLCHQFVIFCWIGIDSFKCFSLSPS